MAPFDNPRTNQFQSAPPTRGATVERKYFEQTVQFQSAPPTRGATLMGDAMAVGINVSIRAPHAGGDAPAPGYGAT